MIATFLDTSFLLAVIRTTDQHHQAALAWKRELEGPFVTTDFVLLEFLDACSPVALRRRGLEAMKVINADSDTKVVRVSPALMDAGIAAFERYGDKAWSLTDCISFSVMREQGIQDALASDRHFVQAGFRALLRESPPAG